MADYESTDHDQRLEQLIARARAARDRARNLQRKAEDALTTSRAARQLVTDTRQRLPIPQPGSRLALLRNSEFLRLVARVETMPVIEQAKGILMTQSRCSEAEAFNLLRRASQRSNIPVRDLAAQIVIAAGRAPSSPVQTPNGHAGPRAKAG